MVDTATKLRRAFIAAPKILYCVLLVLLCITFADLRHRERTFDNAETRILQDIFENVNKAPIYDIKTATSGTCTTGYDLVILGKWDGSVQGCYCGTTLYAGACTSSSSSCSSVSSITSSSFNTYDGVQFCVARVASFTNPNSSGACSSGKLCAANICVPTTATCPITDLRYMTVTTTSTTPTGYTAVSINSTISLIFTNTVADEAITYLQVSLYDNPCMDPDAMPYTTDREPYILSAVPENGCGGTGTVDHLELINRKGAGTLFSENNLNAIVSALPGFSTYISDQYTYFVGARQYLVMNSGSCPTISTSYITNCKTYENNFVNNVYGILIAGLVVISVIFFLNIIEFVFLARKNEEENHWTRFFGAVNLLATLGLCVLCIIVGGVAANTKLKMSSDVAVLNYLAANQCFKQEVVNRTVQVVRGNISNFYAILWLSICQLIAACAGIIITIIIGLINIGYAKRTGGFTSYYRSVGRRLKRKGNKPQGSGVPSGTRTPANIEMLISSKTVV